jgi:hypothetical protein
LVADYFIFAVLPAVKAKNALGYSYASGRLTAAFARFFAQHTVAALALCFADSPNSEPAEYAKQSSQRADKSAVKSWYHNIEQYRR